MAPLPNSPDEKPYRILSLDGGGSWALIQAKVLSDMYGEETQGRKILDRFHLVAATSGGSIVLAGLAADMTPREIEGVFLNENYRREMFRDRSWLTPLYRYLGFLPRYSAEEKLRGLENVIKTASDNKPAAVNDIRNAWIQNISKKYGFRPDLLITAFDYETRRGKLFRSSTHSFADVGGNPNERCRLLEAVHASSNAPIRYFDKPADVRFFEDPQKSEYSKDLEPTQHRKFWDGATGALNNPVLAAVTEALANGIKPEDIIVLSIGTGTVRKKPCLEKPFPPLWFKDLQKMATTILDDPPDSASFIAHVALTNGNREQVPIVRMNPVITDECIFENKEDFNRLEQMGMDAVEQTDVRLIVKVAEMWQGSSSGIFNQLIRPYELSPAAGASSSSPSADSPLKFIGDSSYGEAREHWRKLSEDETILKNVPL